MIKRIVKEKNHQEDKKKFSNKANLNQNLKQNADENFFELFLNRKSKILYKIISIFEKYQNKPMGISMYLPHLNTIFSGDVLEQDYIFFESLLDEMDFDIYLTYTKKNSQIPDVLKNVPSQKIKNLNFFKFSNADIQLNLKDYLDVENKILANYVNYLSNSANHSEIEKEKITDEIFNFFDITIQTKICSILENLNENTKLSLNIIIDILKNIFPSTDFIIENPNDFLRINFDKIEFFNSMHILKNSLKDLKIFDEKIHPSQVKGKGKSKEGLSLFNFFNNCITSQGKRLVKQIFNNPLKDLESIKSRQDCVEDFMTLDTASKKFITKVLREIKDIHKIIEDLKSFIIHKKTWNYLFKTLLNFNYLYEKFSKEMINKNSSCNFELLTSTLSKIDLNNIEYIFNLLTNCINFMENEEENNLKIKVGVSEELDFLTKEYKKLDEVLSKYAENYSRKIPTDSFLQKFMVIFFPQIGYMIAVEKSKKYKEFIKQVYDLYEEHISNLENAQEETDNDNMGKVRKSIGNLNIELRGSYNTTNKESVNHENNDFIAEEQVYNLIIQDKKILDDSIKVKNRKINGKTQQNLMQNSNSTNNLKHIKYQVDESSIIHEYGENEQEEEDNDSMNEEVKVHMGNKDHLCDEFDLENFDLTNAQESETLYSIIFKDLNLRFQFHNESNVYFKNETTDELDKNYGDISAKITDIENGVFRSLSLTILQHENDLIHLNEFLSYFDVFYNFSIAASNLTLTKPCLCEETISYDNNKRESELKCYKDLNFIQGRNLLCEFICEEKNFIKSDFFSNNKNIFYIVGDQGSGKSIFLKLIGNLIFLTQIGLFVPAINYKSFIFQRMFTVIDNYENNIDKISGFTTELKNMKTVVNYFSQILESMEADKAFNQYLNTVMLIDDPFRKTSIKNKTQLLSSFILYMNSAINYLNKVSYINKNKLDLFDENIKNNSNLIKDPNFEKVNFKIFITLNSENFNLMVRNKIIDFEISDVYHFNINDEDNQPRNNFRLNSSHSFNKFRLTRIKNLDKIIHQSQNLHKDAISNISNEKELDINIYYKTSNIIESFKNKIPILPQIQNHSEKLQKIANSAFLLKKTKLLFDKFAKLRYLIGNK